MHGGGASISQAMEAAGIEPRWSEGRRITDAATMDIVQRESERLNLGLVNRLFELGGAALGLVPSRQCVVQGEVLDPELELVWPSNRSGCRPFVALRQSWPDSGYSALICLGRGANHEYQRG